MYLRRSLRRHLECSLQSRWPAYSLRCGNKTLRLWDVKSGRALRTFDGHSAGILSVAFSPDGRRVLSGAEDKVLRLWDAESGRALHIFEGHSAGILSVAFSPDGRRVLSG